jgi:hypothetical protein
MPDVLPPVGEITLRRKTQARKIQEMFAEQLTTRREITNVENNGSGLIRITTSGAHGLSNGDRIIIDAVTGTTEANGYWAITSVNSTQFTLDSSNFANAWAGEGTVCDGQSYSIVMGSSCDMLVSVDLKQVVSGVVTPKKIAKNITTTTETEVFRSVSDGALAISCLTITNNSGATETGSVRLRMTKAQSNVVEILTPFSLLNGYKMVIGGDGNQAIYTDTGLPYVTA